MIAGDVFWDPVIPSHQARMEHIKLVSERCELRRSKSDYNTGSITWMEACCLWALAEHIKAKTVIEVGTFIGMSTESMASASSVRKVYTCDVSNDCLEATDAIRTYPRLKSTAMLTDLLRRHIRSDLCFFDGVLSEADAGILERLTHPGTVYAFHDYWYGQKRRVKNGVVTLESGVPMKGIGNVRLMHPQLQNHVLVDPLPGSSLALLVPESLL